MTVEISASLSSDLGRESRTGRPSRGPVDELLDQYYGNSRLARAIEALEEGIDHQWSESE